MLPNLSQRYAHIPPSTVRFWAWLDSSVTWMLALPPLAPKFIAMIFTMNGWMGGASTAPVFEPIHLLFVCLTGALVSTWVVARLLVPLGVLAVIDGWGRLVVGFILIYCLLVLDAPMVLWMFVATEWLGALAQLRAAYWPQKL